MMNWLSTQFGSLRRRGLRPAPHVAAVAVHNSMHWVDPALAANTRVYQQSPWVYVAVNRIAEAAALVPLQVFRLEGERRVQVERHPLEALLDVPNPYLSRFELLEQTVGMLELCGNAYWFLAGDGQGTPVEIWTLSPERITIVPDPVRYVKGYLYEIDGRQIPLEPEEVIHFKRWHPSNDYYGLSALEAARLSITSDRAMAQWNSATFGRENGVPAGIVTIKDFVSDADLERIKREWRDSYGGPQRRTAFLRGDGVKWENIGLSHHELDFLKGREAHRDEILNIFGIPVGLVSENATEANATVAERQFIERTLYPKLVRLAQKITQELLPFWSGDYVAEFEDIRPTDTQARLEEIRAAYPVLSINEIRARFYNMPSVAWGELPVGTPIFESTSVGTRHLVSSEKPTSGAEAPTSSSEPATATKSALDELRRWERFALKRRASGSARRFQVRALPDTVAFEVAAGLQGASSPAEIKSVFATARAALLGEVEAHDESANGTEG
jgi:HK97 family phage portal protein